ncbi:MAG: DUF3134 domain-containing protein [Leptolyngbya sp. Prado105]|jgi:hypothetical protein|nr:DUF3134 domain-containing protein [Leptolyngbya sp. Prado105]
MKKVYNPSMQEEPYNHPTWIIPTRQEETILGWLERSGRLLAQDFDTSDDEKSDPLVDQITDGAGYLIQEDDDDDFDDDLSDDD